MGQTSPLQHSRGVIVKAYRQFLESSGRRPGTVGLRVAHINRLAKTYPLLSATPEQLIKWMARQRELAPETRKALRSSLKAFYGWAHRTGLIESDPSIYLDPIRIPRRIPRIAKDEQVLQALSQATLHERGMILCARLAALRLTEFSKLHTRDRDGDMLRIIGKGDKERIVFINDELMAVLLEIEALQGDGYYFPGRFGGHIHPQSANKIITRLTGTNPHSLRHAAATASYRNTGQDLRAVQEMLGHASMATTQRYLHVDEENLRRAAQATALKRVA